MDLDQFCILAASQKGLACSAIIQQVLSSKKIFLFGELINVPSVQQLSSSEHIKAYQTLELFAYGRYKNFLESPELYLELTDIQLKKLRQLTLVSLAAESTSLSYDLLMRELDLNSMRALEEVIIDAINLELLRAKINQRDRLVHVFDFLGRDVRAGDVDILTGRLADWRAQCDEVIVALENSSSTYRSLASAQAMQQSATQKQAEDMRKAVQDVPAVDDDLIPSSRLRRGPPDSGRKQRGSRNALIAAFDKK